MNTIKEKVTAPTAAAITMTRTESIYREISVSRVAFQPPPKKRKNAGDGDDDDAAAAAAGRLVQSGVLYMYYNARWTSKRNQNFQY